MKFQTFAKVKVRSKGSTAIQTFLFDIISSFIFIFIFKHFILAGPWWIWSLSLEQVGIHLELDPNLCITGYRTNIHTRPRGNLASPIHLMLGFWTGEPGGNPWQEHNKLHTDHNLSSGSNPGDMKQQYDHPNLNNPAITCWIYLQDVRLQYWVAPWCSG